MSLTRFVKTNWIGILGSLIGIAGLTLSFYFYKMSIALPEPVFLLDPSRTVIIDSERLSETPLRVVRLNGNEIKGDITSVRFYFWNNGRKSIRPLNVLKPLVIALDDAAGEIIDYKVLKSSRSVVDPVIARHSADPKRSLDLSFSILEQEDGLSGQLLYKGKPDANVTISGTVENVSEIITDQRMIQRRFWKEYGGKIAFVILAICSIVTLAFCSRAFTKLLQSKSTIVRSFAYSIGYLFLGILIVVFIYAIIIGPIKEAQARASTTFTQTVPADIIP